MFLERHKVNDSLDCAVNDYKWTSQYDKFSHFKHYTLWSKEALDLSDNVPSLFDFCMFLMTSPYSLSDQSSQQRPRVCLQEAWKGTDQNDSAQYLSHQTSNGKPANHSTYYYKDYSSQQSGQQPNVTEQV